MLINYAITDEFIENAPQDETYSYAEVCTLIHMARNEESLKYVHDSVLDPEQLLGKASYSYLNDDEVRIIIDELISRKETELTEKFEGDKTNLQLEYESKISDIESSYHNEATESLINIVNNLQYAKVVSDGTEAQTDMVQ